MRRAGVVRVAGVVATLGIIAGSSAVAGAALTADGDGVDEIHACVTRGFHILRVPASGSCGAKERPLSWQAGVTESVVSTEERPARGETDGDPVFAVSLRLTRGTWRVEGAGRSDGCPYEPNVEGGSLSSQFFAAGDSTQPVLIVDITSATGSVTIRCQAAREFASIQQLVGTPVVVQ